MRGKVEAMVEEEKRGEKEVMGERRRRGRRRRWRGTRRMKRMCCFRKATLSYEINHIGLSNFCRNNRVSEVNIPE